MGGCWARLRSQQEEAVKLPENPDRDQTGVPENPSPVPSAPSPTSPPLSLPPHPSSPLLPNPVSPSLPLLPTAETAPPALSHPSLLEPTEDTSSSTLDACPGPSTSRRALQEDLPQGPNSAEASSLQPPCPIFTWSSSSASTKYLRLSTTPSLSPSCLSLNPSPSPPQHLFKMEEKLENLMLLQNKQMEDRQEGLMIFRAHIQHVVVLSKQLQELRSRLSQLEDAFAEK
ncbi:uncharacterized protein LOC128350583 [Hemicordylus capensis]|uniref:uncharacterized protein LOC128350583 n=1 Tax=Hemicordylus capensis TaxID=884348 RepID=UPI0023045B8A|nr:uncharacterized protein LOC128350583 [Hemicordylus capensis]